ncbi:hypothetical protein C8F01DRAFT_1245377 [Mycena amicta]|nr:hypothetical protein C8F01DRAFT_1245377 [Mycena amicta]
MQQPFWPTALPIAAPAAVSRSDSLAVAFAADFFDGIVPGAKTYRDSAFHWPIQDVCTEDRLLLALRSIRKAGFPTLGAFWRQSLTKANILATGLYPLKYLHFCNTKNATRSTIPPPSSTSSSVSRNRSGGIRDWQKSLSSHSRVMRDPHPFVSMPASFLLAPTAQGMALSTGPSPLFSSGRRRKAIEVQHGFVRLPGSAPWTWEGVLSAWSIVRNEETLATVAPAIFAVATTLAVSRGARKRLETAAAPDLPFFGDLEDDSDTRTASNAPIPDPDSDSEDFDAGTDTGSAPGSFASVGRRNPWQGVTCALLLLLHFRYSLAVIFPMLIGLFAFTCNAHRELFSLLCRIGLSVSYKTTLALLHVLAADSDAQLKLLGAFASETGPMFLLLFDNANKMQRAWQAVLGRKDDVKSGTAATVIELEDVPTGALSSAPYLANVEARLRCKLTVEGLLNDIDEKHVEGVGAATVLRIWLKHIPSLARFRPEAEELFASKYSKHPLRLRKSKIHPMRSTDIDESTTVGAGSVLQNLVSGQLLVAPLSLMKWLVFVLPVIQLWHLKWARQKAIFRLHWFPDVEKDFFGLHRDCIALERKKFNADKCDFYPAHHILEDRFEAMVLEALRLDICIQERGEHAESLMLLDAVRWYFKADGPLKECSFRDLHGFAAQVYNRYMCAAAADDALNHGSRDLDTYGPPGDPMLPEAPVTQDVDEDLDTEPQPTKKRSRKDPPDNFSKGDHLLRFGFWGAGSTNYGNELLELACNFLYEFPEDLKAAVFNNYLVNPSGRAGSWHEPDLLQEHFNFWIKHLFNSKSHDFDGKHLSEAVGLNIAGISRMRELFPGMFGLKCNGQKHRKADTAHDLNKLGMHYRDDQVLLFRAGRTHMQIPDNDFDGRINKLLDGQLKKFLDRTTHGGPVNNTDDTNFETGTQVAEVPTNPMTVCDGTMDISEFVMGQ